MQARQCHCLNMAIYIIHTIVCFPFVVTLMIAAHNVMLLSTHLMHVMALSEQSGWEWKSSFISLFRPIARAAFPSKYIVVSFHVKRCNRRF